MFCGKCGTQIKDTDQFCPNCGEENINYSPSLHIGKRVALQIGKGYENTSDDDSADHSAKRKVKKTKFLIGGICIVAVVCIALMLFKPSHKNNDKVKYSSKGLRGYVGEETIYFIQKDGVKKFLVAAKSGTSTPDQSKYVVLLETGAIELKRF